MTEKQKIEINQLNLEIKKYHESIWILIDKFNELNNLYKQQKIKISNTNKEQVYRGVAPSCFATYPSGVNATANQPRFWLASTNNIGLLYFNIFLIFLRIFISIITSTAYSIFSFFLFSL